MTDTSTFDRSTNLKTKAETLIAIGVNLMAAGANTGRIRFTIERIAKAWDVHSEFLITNRVLLMTITTSESDEIVTIVKRTPMHGVNFRIVSGISRLSWRVVYDKINAKEVSIELERLRNLPHYNRWVVLILVGFAGFSFCYNFGGTIQDACITALATFFGLWVRQETHKINFNPYIVVFFSAFAATMVSGIYSKLYISDPKDYYALATSVLYLIPGVPLINSFSDFIDGNLLNGSLRFINSLIIAFSIALGFMFTYLILKF